MFSTAQTIIYKTIYCDMTIIVLYWPQNFDNLGLKNFYYTHKNDSEYINGDKIIIV